MNECIKFPDAYLVTNLLPLLSNFLALFDGCRSMMMEISSKFYHSELKAKSREISCMQSKLNATKAGNVDTTNSGVGMDILNIHEVHVNVVLQRELSSERLVDFANKLDHLYCDDLIHHYHSFTSIYDPIVSRKDLLSLAKELKLTFPTFYSALLVILDAGRVGV